MQNYKQFFFMEFKLILTLNFQKNSNDYEKLFNFLEFMYNLLLYDLVATITLSLISKKKKNKLLTQVLPSFKIKILIKN